MKADVFDADGRSLTGAVGELVVRRPWPSMTQGLWNEPERFIETYWSRWHEVWVHGDRAIRHRDESWEILGRSDDVLKLAGKRVGPVEIETVVTELSEVSDAAAVAIPDPVKGDALVVLMVPSSRGTGGADRLSEKVSERVAAALGSPLRPSAVLCVEELPLSRSGKVHRRVARAWLTGGDPGDLSTLGNPESEEAIARARTKLKALDPRMNMR